MTSGSLRAVRVEAAHELVIAAIRRAVESWEFAPGDLLPSERELAELLGVSRNTIRTATAVLESERFISVRRGRGGGYVVEDPALVSDRGAEVRRSPDRLRHAFEQRVIAESGSAWLAAERRTPADLETLQVLRAELDREFAAYLREETLEGSRRCQVLDAELHLVIARSTRNPLVVESVVAARRRFWIAFSSYLSRLDPTANDGHACVVDAIADRDPPRAAAEMRSHIEGGRVRFEAWLLQAESAAVPPWPPVDEALRPRRPVRT